MSKLKFLVDMNISPLTVLKLKKQGWDILRVNEILDKKSEDIAILEYARENKRVIITQDLDFSELVALGQYSDISIINLRLKNAQPDFITKRILEVVDNMGNQLKQGVIVSADEISARYRELPISR